MQPIFGRMHRFIGIWQAAPWAFVLWPPTCNLWVINHVSQHPCLVMPPQPPFILLSLAIFIYSCKQDWGCGKTVKTFYYSYRDIAASQLWVHVESCPSCKWALGCSQVLTSTFPTPPRSFFHVLECTCRSEPWSKKQWHKYVPMLFVPQETHPAYTCTLIWMLPLTQNRYLDQVNITNLLCKNTVPNRKTI